MILTAHGGQILSVFVLHVPSDVPAPRRGVPTACDWAPERPLSRVLTDVCCQVCRLRGGVVTILPWAFERPVARVCAYVTLEMPRAFA